MLVSQKKRLRRFFQGRRFVANSRFIEVGALMIAACRKIFFALLAVSATFLCVSAYAQSGGATLQGTVSDSSSALVPNAHIHILAELTGVSRDVESNNAGFYSAPNLNAGRYKLTFTSSQNSQEFRATLSQITQASIPHLISMLGDTSSQSQLRDLRPRLKTT